MEIKYGYLISQIKIYYEMFMEIKYGFQTKNFSNQGSLL